MKYIFEYNNFDNDPIKEDIEEIFTEISDSYEIDVEHGYHDIHADDEGLYLHGSPAYNRKECYRVDVDFFYNDKLLNGVKVEIFSEYTKLLKNIETAIKRVSNMIPDFSDVKVQIVPNVEHNKDQIYIMFINTKKLVITDLEELKNMFAEFINLIQDDPSIESYIWDEYNKRGYSDISWEEYVELTYDIFKDSFEDGKFYIPINPNATADQIENLDEMIKDARKSKKYNKLRIQSTDGGGMTDDYLIVSLS